MKHLILLLSCLSLLALQAVGRDAPRLEIPPDDAVRLQIFLDQENFGPGVIDGKPGRFTTLAVQAWNEANGYELNELKGVLKAARKQVKYPFATAVVPRGISEWVDPELPLDRPGQAEKKRMSYRRKAEFLAERYHCDEGYLRSLNAGKNLEKLKAGGCFIDIRSAFDADALRAAGRRVWRL